MDFTPTAYQSLLTALKKSGYAFQTFEEFLLNPLDGKSVVLRHDIDKRPENALRLARVEYNFGVKASYYIRIVTGTWSEDIVKKIASLGHEVSYHYEDLSIAKGDYEKAFEHFNIHLARIRKFYPAKTICMHGSPLSKWDNRKLWDKYDYRQSGIIGEPYFDVDYSKVLYITDTGRAWNNAGVSVRDKMDNGLQVSIKSASHLASLLDKDQLPNQIIINTHPQRWFNFGFLWMQELMLQNMKNIVKRVLIKLSNTHQ